VDGVEYNSEFFIFHDYSMIIFLRLSSDFESFFERKSNANRMQIERK